MALTVSVMTGGVNNHPTTSEEANGLATDFVNEGIVNAITNTSNVAPMTGGFAVNAQGTPAMAVDVSSGVAYVEGTPTSQNAQTFRVKSSATESVAISANSSGSTKYDWLYIKLDATLLNAPTLAGTTTATLVTSRSTSNSADDGTPPTYGYPIAVITVANGATSITNGNIRDLRSRVTLDTGSTLDATGWTTLSAVMTVSSGYNKGNKEYDITTDTSLVNTLTPGMRLKLSRGTTPPTQCTDLESSSSQYATRASASVSGISFTDDFTVEAWVKLESYGTYGVVTRSDGSNSWLLFLESDGRVVLSGSSAAASNYRRVTSYQSIPLSQWVHIAVTLDMSGFTTATNKVYINGVEVPAAVSQSGTNPTALVQGGPLQIGAINGANFFDGKIADVRVWSAIRTATQIRDNMNQQLVGNETNLVGYWKLDGNFNDSTSNANNLTGQGGAVATSTDNPMNSTEYAIVTKVATTTVTVFTGTDYNIPNMTLSNPQYSSMKAPYGFPADRGKWKVESLISTTLTVGSPTGSTWVNIPGAQISVPTGSFITGYSVVGGTAKGASARLDTMVTLSTATNTEADHRLSSGFGGSNGTFASANANAATGVQLTSQTPYYINMYYDGSLGARDNLYLLGAIGQGRNVIYAECAYV